jgi:hypothetical protein
MALTRLMGRQAFERWLQQNGQRLSFEALAELDFALYAPRWLAKANPRIGDELLGMDLGMIGYHRADW